MKKIYINVWLLTICLLLIGCVHETYGYQFHFYVDGGNGIISIKTAPSFNPDVRLCSEAGDMCSLNCSEMKAVEYFFVVTKTFMSMLYLVCKVLRIL